MLGLYLSTNFGVFSGYSSDAARPHTPTWFRFHERIVTIDPAQVWDEYVRVCDSPKSVTPPVFDFEPADLAPATVKRRGAVQPPGEYAYHAEIKRVSERLCQEGNFRQAVLDAFIRHVPNAAFVAAVVRPMQPALLRCLLLIDSLRLPYAADRPAKADSNVEFLFSPLLTNFNVHPKGP